uniref:Sarcosine dehydrogenase n=1 Tax=Salarias fasciatus TaxID=181472 RepID=A0A672IZV7_SALFA
MAFLGSAVRRVASAVRPPLSPLCRTSTRSYSSEHTKEKSVPYEKTLKQDAGAASGPTKPLPRSADVVVIGGGSLGCQTVYHLAKMGMTNVVLLERDRLTAGTTWHTAGLLWQLRPSDVEVELLGHTRNVVSRDLEEETGLHTGWIQNGGLFIASNKQRLDEYKRLMSLGKVYGIESHVLSPAETKDVYPLMNVDDLYGTLYVPTDGTMDPAGTCTTLTRAASARGATVIENCPVTGIQVRADDLGVKRVKAVETAHGTIETPCVVNCAGVWATKLGKMAGVNVPLVAMHHAYVVTERIEGIQNMPNVRDHDASVYLRLQGDALSVGGYEPNPIFWDDVSDKFAFSLFDLDWDVFMTHIEGAINRVPVLEQTGIKSTVCGPESFTADHKPLMGEAPEVRGFFLGCGFNSAGMMLGGGCGRELAHWVIHGRPERDMYGYDIRRFHNSLTGNQRWIRERSHESYANNYSVVFPFDEPRVCVFQERHDGPAPLKDYDYYGCYDVKKNENYKYNELLGKEYTFDFPPHHDVIKAECLSCRHGVAVFDMSYFGKFYLTGPDAKKAADWLFTADVNKKPVLLLCFPLFAPGDAYYLAIGGGVAEHNWNHIRTVLQDQGFRCQLTDHSEDMGMISIQGPKRGGGREGILQEVLDTDLSNEAFPFSSHKVVKAAGHQVRAMRLSFVGELGWELHIPRDACLPVYNAVMAAGAKHGIINSGYRAIDSLSIEKGNAQVQALARGAGFHLQTEDSIPFQGRETLEKQKEEGLKRRIVCFTIDEKVPMFGLEAIFRNGVPVGHLRRSDYGFLLIKLSVMMVSADFIKSGEFTLERMGVTYKARAHLKSPFDPENKRVKGIYA